MNDNKQRPETLKQTENEGLLRRNLASDHGVARDSVAAHGIRHNPLQ